MLVLVLVLVSGPKVDVPTTSAVGLSVIGTCHIGSVAATEYGEGSHRSPGRIVVLYPLRSYSLSTFILSDDMETDQVRAPPSGPCMVNPCAVSSYSSWSWLSQVKLRPSRYCT